MKNYGLVSIITPLYNNGDTIEETIKSIQSQTYRNWEMLIVDDCSSDKGCTIVKNLCMGDSRIKLFHLEKNSGPGIARNLAIERSKGEYIAMCDGDDLWLPTKLEKQLKFMDEKGIFVTYGSAYYCSQEGVINGVHIAFRMQTYKDVCRGDRMGSDTIIYNANKLGKIYMPSLRKRQDWGWKIKIMEKAKIAYGILEPLAIYRERENSVSSNKSSLIKYNVAIYKEVLHMNTFNAWMKFIFLNIPHIIFKKYRNKIINQ